MRSGIVLTYLLAVSIAAQQSSPEIRMTTLYVRGEQYDSARLDVYVAVPYSLLQFVQTERSKFATYHLTITITDSSMRHTPIERNLERSLTSSDNSSSKATIAEDITQTIVTVSPGTYRVHVVVNDQFSTRQWRVAQKVIIPDYRTTAIGISGILLVSRIEERNRRYVLTPYIGSDITPLEKGFFAFFELYSSMTSKLVVRARVLDSLTPMYSTPWQEVKLEDGIAQHFVRIVLPTIRIPQGTYRLIIEAGNDTTRIEAKSERNIEVRYSISSTVFADINKAIRQLRYIATQAEIDSMLAKPTETERRAAFEHFWKEHDPTPGTLQNEAFDEYFSRIEYANRNFRSYAEGWLTDMGMVYIVLGEPSSIERRTSPYDNRSIVIWTYTRLNRRYIFIDNSGFGDYRLSPSTPFFLSEKYRYSGLQ